MPVKSEYTPRKFEVGDTVKVSRPSFSRWLKANVISCYPCKFAVEESGCPVICSNSGATCPTKGDYIQVDIDDTYDCHGYSKASGIMLVESKQLMFDWEQDKEDACPGHLG